MTVAPLEIAYNFLHDEPRSAARLLETRDRQAVAGFLEQAPIQDAAATLAQMQAYIAGPVLADFSQARAAEVASLLSNHQLCTLLRPISKDDRQKILTPLPEWRRLSCITLLRFEEDTVGALTQTDVPILSVDLTVDECLVRLKKQTFRRSNNVFFVDPERKLAGALSLAELMLANPQRLANTLEMTDIPQINGRTPTMAAINHAGWEQADTLAVVSSRKAFVGVVEHHALRAALAAPIVTHSHRRRQSTNCSARFPPACLACWSYLKSNYLPQRKCNVERELCPCRKTFANYCPLPKR